MITKEKEDLFLRFNVVLITLFIVSLILIKFMSTSNYELIVLSTLYDILVYIIILQLYLLLPRFRYDNYLYYVIFISHTLISIIYSYFLGDISDRNYSLISMTYGNVIFFLTNLMPHYFIIAIPLLIILIIFLASKLSKHISFNFEFLRKKWILVLLLFFALITSLVFSISNPYINTFGEVKAYIYSDGINDSDLNYNVSFEKTLFYKGITDFDANLVPKYDRILIFVQEEISKDRFLRDININEDNFYSKNKLNSYYYENYYTTNQDSRTALMTILSSSFIPYEAYSSQNWYNLYGSKIFNKYSLVNFFNDINYTTVFSAPLVGIPFEMTKYPWKYVISINEEDYTKYSDYTCLHIIQYERGCEDLVLFDKIVDKIEDNNKLFYLHEFVYGHTSKYIDIVGKSRAKYYMDFYDKLINHLKDRNLYDGTLIVILSDHGPRARNSGRIISDYKIPLIFISNDIVYGEDLNFYSHLSFKDILFSRIYGLNLTSEKEMYHIGPTGSGILAYNSYDGRSFVINREQNTIVYGNIDLIRSKYSSYLSYRNLEYK